MATRTPETENPAPGRVSSGPRLKSHRRAGSRRWAYWRPTAPRTSGLAAPRVRTRVSRSTPALSVVPPTGVCGPTPPVLPRIGRARRRAWAARSLNRSLVTSSPVSRISKRRVSKFYRMSPICGTRSVSTAEVVLPDHLHCVWSLPGGDADYSTRWGLIKATFSRAIGPRRAAFGELAQAWGTWHLATAILGTLHS